MSAATTAPAAPATGRAWQALLAAALFALGLFLPWSTAGTSISLAALLLLYAVAGKRAFTATPWRDPLVVVGLWLLAWIVVRNLIASGPTAQAARIANHYHELLMVPLLWALVRMSARRDAFLYGLLAGAVGFALAHWLPVSHMFAFKLELRRISAGFGLALCAFMFVEQARLGKMPRAAGCAAAAFLALTVLFAIEARTGHIVLLLLAVLAGWRATQAKWRWVVVAGVVVAAALAAVLVPSAQERRGDIAMSNQIRTELARGTVDVVKDHWLLGVGWLGFGKAYADAAAARGVAPKTHGAQSENPHSEYLMQAAGGGIAALGLFLAWLAIPLLSPLQRRKTGGSQTGVVACIALAFAVGCAFNSMLLDFAEGHLYTALLAWLMAQRE